MADLIFMLAVPVITGALGFALGTYREDRSYKREQHRADVLERLLAEARGE